MIKGEKHDIEVKVKGQVVLVVVIYIFLGLLRYILLIYRICLYLEIYFCQIRCFSKKITFFIVAKKQVINNSFVSGCHGQSNKKNILFCFYCLPKNRLFWRGDYKSETWPYLDLRHFLYCGWTIVLYKSHSKNNDCYIHHIWPCKIHSEY